MSLPGCNSLMSPELGKDDLGRIIFGVLLAIPVAPNCVLVLCFGVVGSAGYRLVVGGLLAIAPAFIGWLCLRREIVFQHANYLFLALLLCVFLSLSING